MSPDSPTFLAIYIITFLIGFPNSVLAFFSCIHKIQSKPIPIDIFMLNLTASDLVFLIFLPIKMKEALDDMVWKMPDFLCLVSLFVFYVPLYVSSLFLTGISVERYVCVAFPVKYKSPKRIIYTVLICVGIWVLAAVTSICHYMAVYRDSDTSDTANQTMENRCYSNFTEKQLQELLPMRLSLAVVLFLLPLLICCFCYINFIHILLKLPLINRKRKLRAIGLALGTLLIFASSFGPFSVSHFVGFIKKENPKWRMRALMLSTLNVCYDVIIFFCISRKMRRAIEICAKAFFHVYAYLKQFRIVHMLLQNGV